MVVVIVDTIPQEYQKKIYNIVERISVLAAEMEMAIWKDLQIMKSLKFP